MTPEPHLFEFLFHPGEAVEVRVVAPWCGSGFFDNAADLGEALSELDAIKPDAIYCTLNPVTPEAFNRAPNEFRRAVKGQKLACSGPDIARRKWILIDCDALRPKNVSATDEEKSWALAKARAIRDFLLSEGAPPMVEADSGNGAHLLLACSLPNDKASTALVKGFLEFLSDRFTDSRVKVDTINSNPDRITKAYGTYARKGPDTPERPHRRSGIISLPTTAVPVSRALLEKWQLKPLSPHVTEIGAEEIGAYEIKKLTEWAATVQDFPAIKQIKREADKVIVIPEHCYFDAAHEGTSAGIVFHADGGRGNVCKHEGCALPFKEWWRKVEALYGRALPFGPVLIIGKGADEAREPDWNPRLELERVDYIDRLADELTKGTPLPFSFARETLKMLLLAGLHEPPILPWFKTLHMRQYVILLSDEAGVGKGECWRRAVATLFKADIHTQFMYDLIDGDNLGSPEYSVVRFGGRIEKKSKTPSPVAPVPLTPKMVVRVSNPHHVVYYDEGKRLEQKNQAAGSSGLVTMFVKLFDSNRHSMGSLRNGSAVVLEANVSLMLHFVREAFELTFAGTGVTSDGFLSRCTFVFDHRNPLEGDWQIVDSVLVAGLIEQIRGCMKRTTIDIAPEVAEARVAFVNELRQWEPKVRSRLEFLFNQDLLARAVFSPAGRMDAATVDRAAKWTRHQYETRLHVYPLDISRDKNEQMSATLRNAFLAHGPLTKAQGMKYGNVSRIGSGGYVVFAHVWGAMGLDQVGKTRKGTPFYWPPDLGAPLPRVG